MLGRKVATSEFKWYLFTLCNPHHLQCQDSFNQVSSCVICLFMFQYYNFTLFAMMLNELQDSQKSILPLTDARLRPDIRKLEEGDIGEYFLCLNFWEIKIAPKWRCVIKYNTDTDYACNFFFCLKWNLGKVKRRIKYVCIFNHFAFH